MKIRTGFVSNSSSSSFIAKLHYPFSCPIEVAQHMLMNRDYPSDSAMLQKLTRLVRNGTIKPSTNLCFPSTNYDTYIYYIGDDKMGIYTCNNIDWHFPNGVSGDNEDSGYESSHGKEFVMIDSGCRGSRVSDEISKKIHSDTNKTMYDLWCQNCHTDQWISEATNALGEKETILVCPRCQRIICKKSAKGKWKVA